MKLKGGNLGHIITLNVNPFLTEWSREDRDCASHWDGCGSILKNALLIPAASILVSAPTASDYWPAFTIKLMLKRCLKHFLHADPWPATALHGLRFSAVLRRPIEKNETHASSCPSWITHIAQIHKVTEIHTSSNLMDKYKVKNV